jgi:SAM-dependent methyltransferase
MTKPPGDAEQHDTPEGVIENKPADTVVEVNTVGEEITRDPNNADVAANYRYWQQHGGEWADEYDQRKLHEIKYHIQEWMILDYVRRLALEYTDRPVRVLEYGCGVGRHLANLAKLPNVDVRGFDQSPTMVEGCRRWTSREWIDEHITVGDPTGPLPFDDDEIDLVYTAEVLVHVRPEDVPNRLEEMMRVAKRQVLHIEPSEHFRVASDVHFGCWKHDLVAIYAALGVECDTLPSGFFSQAPYRVVLGGDADPYGWCPVALGLMRRMEEDTIAGRKARFAAGRSAGQDEARATDEAQHRATRDNSARRQRAAKARIRELNETVAQLNADLAKQTKAATQARAETDRIRTQRENQQAKLQALQGAANKLEQTTKRLGDVSAELTEAQRLIKALQQADTALRHQLTEARSALAETESRVTAAEAERDQVLDQLNRELVNARDNVLSLERRRQADRSRIARTAAQQERFIAQIDRIMGAKK